MELNIVASSINERAISEMNGWRWSQQIEVEDFHRMTTFTLDPRKQNVVIMDLATWHKLPINCRPLPNRITFVVSHTDDDILNAGARVFRSLNSCFATLKKRNFQYKYEKVWVIGGQKLFKDAVECEYFQRVFFTRI
ncbi:dihydrofolate reductase-like [Diorhabda carinulata]|uniref:dihydrofolate reductase-like n=1 Tax=Diorhabda carinulata TaxID=1163345 RepID=UPI0025A19EA3|nr:dihydrofolate reductase-like [Diorhabda carinulata]